MLSTSTIFVSCNSDDNNEENEIPIVGKWELFETALQLADVEFIPYYQVFGNIECGKDFMKFNFDYSAQNIFFRNDNDGNCYSDESIYTYSISDENLNFIIEDIIIPVKIEFLTNDWLKILFT